MRIETDRLIISYLTIPDAPFILELVNSPGWLQYIGDRNIKDIAAAENYISNGPMVSYSSNGFGLNKVVLKENNMPVGMCGIIKRDTLEHADIGFAFLSGYTGKGYAQEAASAVLQDAKEVLKLAPILAITREDNQRSIQLLEKLGLQFEKKIRLTPEAEEILLFRTS